MHKYKIAAAFERNSGDLQVMYAASVDDGTVRMSRGLPAVFGWEYEEDKARAFSDIDVALYWLGRILKNCKAHSITLVVIDEA